MIVFCRYFGKCLFAVSSLLLHNGCKNNPEQTFESEIPVFDVSTDKTFIFSYNAGTKIWYINSIPNRDKTRIMFPHLAWFATGFR